MIRSRARTNSSRKRCAWVLLFAVFILSVALTTQSVAAVSEEEGEGEAAPHHIPAGSPLVRELDSFSFYPSIANGQVWFVEFYVPWCRGCKRLAPTWAELAEAVGGYPEISIARLNCDHSDELCDAVGAQRTPSIKVFYKAREVMTYVSEVYHVDLLMPFIIKKAKELMVGPA